MASQPTIPVSPKPATATAGSARRDAAFVDDLNEQLAAARAGRRRKIHLPPGRHEIFPGQLDRRACYVSNNDSGVRPVLFDLIGLDGLEVDGSGAELIFHGEIIPFMAERCRDLSIANLTIDWQRPFLSQGTVLDADDNRIDLEMDADHPFAVESGRLRFLGTDYASDCLHNMLAFDADRRETAFRAIDHYGVMKGLRAERIGPASGHGLRLLGAFAKPPASGQAMVIKHHRRTAPAFCFSFCRGVRVRDVTVHHAGGMAFVGQASRDLSLQRCHVALRPGSSRLFTAHADATHFTDCHGRIELLDCVFENQFDDATNIHGIYRRIDGSGRTDRAHARLVHPQQDGTETLSPGDTLAFFDDRDFAEIGRADVLTVENPDTRSAIYRLAHEVTVREGHTIAMRWDHDIDVRIAGCHARRNRARGFMISTLGRVVIENNRFHVPGAAVQCCFDGSSWYESGPIEDVTIRHNTFDNCLYGVWGSALFAVKPAIDANYRIHPINENLVITNNDIYAADPRLIYAHNIKGLRFAGNRFHRTDAYPNDQTGPAFDLRDAVIDTTLDPAPGSAPETTHRSTPATAPQCAPPKKG